MFGKILTSFDIKQKKIFTNWIYYTFILAALPFVASWLLYLVTGQFRWSVIKNTPEIMFFCIMLSSTTARDINDSSKITDNNLEIYILEKVLTFGGLISAVIYGWILYDTIVGPGSAIFRVNLFPLAIVIGLALFLSSLVAKLLLIQTKVSK